MPSKFPVYEPERGKPLFGLSIALAVITTLVLVLRFWSRLLLPSAKFRSDDWLALAAWPLVAGTAVCGALAMRHGFGTHFEEILASDPAAVPSILIITYVSELTWIFGLGIIRSSAILFYHRIFSQANKSFRKWVAIGVVANIVWALTLALVCVFQCLPVRGYWDKTIDSKCLSTSKIELGSGTTSIALDLYTLLIPMPIIWKLQMRAGKKALTILTFALAYCVIVCTIGRTVAVVTTGPEINGDPTLYFPNIMYWAIIELAIAHICISLPAIFVLGRRGARYGFSSLLSSKDVESAARAPIRYRVEDAHNASKEQLKSGFGYHARVTAA